MTETKATETKAATKAKVKEVSIEELKNLKYDKPELVRIPQEGIGIFVQEVRKADKMPEDVEIPVGYEREIKFGDETGTMILYRNVPGDIDPEMYYPLTEWRMTMEKMDDQDNLPQWKAFPVVINGQPLRDDVGRQIVAQCFVYRAAMGMPEEDDGKFFFTGPFVFSLVKETDIGIPAIKGSDIPEAIAQIRGISTGATRRRGEERVRVG